MEGIQFQPYRSQCLQCESKESPLQFSDIFPKRLGIFNQFLHTYHTLFSTLDYKFLFNYLFWGSFSQLSPGLAMPL